MSKQKEFPEGTIRITYPELKRVLENCRAHVDAAPGEDPPDGYDPSNTELTEVADACWSRAMDQLTAEMLNWAFDELKSKEAEEPKASEGRGVTADELVKEHQRLALEIMHSEENRSDPNKRADELIVATRHLLACWILTQASEESIAKVANFGRVAE